MSNNLCTSHPEMKGNTCIQSVKKNSLVYKNDLVSSAVRTQNALTHGLNNLVSSNVKT